MGLRKFIRFQDNIPRCFFPADALVQTLLVVLQ
jgi:hypothetical protein